MSGKDCDNCLPWDRCTCKDNNPTNNPVLDSGVIFRCGWCGLPVKKDGSFMGELKNSDQINSYLEQYKNYKMEKVNGACCPHGDRDTQERYVTRDMAIDAGDLSLEGQSY